MKANLIFFCSIILISLIIYSCRKGGRCEQALNVTQSEIAVTFKDSATNKYLYSEINPLYNKDSFKVFDPKGNSLVILFASNQIPNTSDGYFVLSFGNIYDQQTDAASFNSELCKDVVVQYKYNERDTIRACFKSKTTKCGSVFETLKVYNRGKLLTTVLNNTFADITVIKK
ncbi:MAG TPA: hypothetical protein VGQ09_11925 [Chitinophagaceae bacterium]|jgi:hypothetical protein|nr:hypothetical protein [Chitinophagaceae bacterium]